VCIRPKEQYDKNCNSFKTEGSSDIGGARILNILVKETLAT
jgi:hypothetical protein